MADQSARLALPLLAAGQAQKEVLHNEALSALDLLVQPRVEAIGTTVPPASPSVGQSWVVGDGASGAWAGRTGQIAGWTSDGWAFASPPDGSQIWIAGEGLAARKSGAGWVRDVNAAAFRVNGLQVLGPRLSAIPAPAGGTTVDVEARTAISALLVMLKSHGLIGS